MLSIDRNRNVPGTECQVKGSSSDSYLVAWHRDSRVLGYENPDGTVGSDLP